MFKKKLFLDVETTGRWANVHGVHQISGEVWVDDKLEESFDLRFRPMTGVKIDVEALKVSNITMEELQARPMSGRAAHEAFIEILGRYVDKYNKRDKLTFIAFNANFDWNFIQEFSQQNDYKFLNALIWFPPICVAQKVYAALGDEMRTSVSDFKLKTVLEYCGIGIDGELHDANVDVRLTRELYYLIEKAENHKQEAERPVLGPNELVPLSEIP